MRKITLLIGSLLFLLNIVLCVLISSYSFFHATYTGVIIAITTSLISLLQKLKISDAFKVSLSLLFIVLGFFEFIVSFFSAETIQDNWTIILSVVLTVGEIGIFSLIYKIDKITK